MKITRVLFVILNTNVGYSPSLQWANVALFEGRVFADGI
jgi:hypothetical protein